MGIISLEDLSGKISVVQEFLDLPIRSHMCPWRHHNLSINNQFRWDYLNRSRSYSLGSSCYSRERRRYFKNPKFFYDRARVVGLCLQRDI